MDSSKFLITIKKDGKVVHYHECECLCLAFDDGDSVQAVVCANPSVDVKSMSVLGCSAASAAVKAVTDTVAERPVTSELSRNNCCDDSNFNNLIKRVK